MYGYTRFRSSSIPWIQELYLQLSQRQISHQLNKLLLRREKEVPNESRSERLLGSLAFVNAPTVDRRHERSPSGNGNSNDKWWG